MNSHEEALGRLGLRTGASWRAINEAYRDLVKVWHPDRFQNDARLLRRAEDQTRLLNHAIELLRDGYDPKKIRTVESRPRKNPSSPEQTSAPEQPTAAERRRPQERGTPEPQRTLLTIHETAASRLGRLALSLIFACIALVALNYGKPHPFRSAFIALAVLLSIHHFVKGLLSLLMRRPVATVDTCGITLTDVGRFCWGDIQRLWTFSNRAVPGLAIECSALYCARQPRLTRIKLKAVQAFRSAHIVVRFSGTDIHPHALVHTVNMIMDSGLSQAPTRLDGLIRFGSAWARGASCIAAISLIGYILSVSSPEPALTTSCAAVYGLAQMWNTWRKLIQTSANT